MDVYGRLNPFCLSLLFLVFDIPMGYNQKDTASSKTREEFFRMNDILSGKEHLHFVGIGGAGMVALAEILHEEGFYITGSDNNESYNLEKVRSMGIPVKMGHAPENIDGADLVVHTAAVHGENPELSEAVKRGIPIIERGPLLGVISKRYTGCIAVSGTHGKTTTTSILTQTMVMAGVDPTAVIGGRLDFIGGNARHGKSQYMVCEACEYVNSYHSIAPDFAVILNIDSDHLEFFKTVDNLIASFRTFASSSSKYVIYNGDDERTCRAVEGLDKQFVTFGFNEKNDFYAKNVTVEGDSRTSFDVYHQGEKLDRISLQVPGEHNVLNALAAYAVCHTIQVAVPDIKKGIEAYGGAHRRFELLGVRNGVSVYDDYAHHPAEIAATLKAAMGMKFNQVWAVFQPFTFSRTYLLMDDFVDALKLADRVVLAPIMGSREVNTYDIHSYQMADKIDEAVVLSTFDEIADYVCANAKPGDMVITLGCGDIYKAADLMLKK